VTLGVSASAAAGDTVAEMSTQLVPPLVEYCHTPWVATFAAAPTTTTPANALAVVPPALSALSSNAGASRVEIVAVGAVSPKLMDPRLTEVEVATGASFDALTYTFSVWLAKENAVMPPVAPTGAASWPPAVPLEVSHARYVSALSATPFQFAVGTKRSPALGSAGRSRAAKRDTAGTAVQLAPPSSVYHQAPTFVVALITAIPYGGSVLASVT